MKQVCGHSSSSSGGLGLTETYFKVDGKPGATRRLAFTVSGDQNAELTYQLHSASLRMTPVGNPPRLRKDETVLTYDVIVPQDLLQQEGLTTRTFYLQAGSQTMRAAIEFARPDDGECKKRDAKGYCVKCGPRFVSWKLPPGSINSFECSGMRPGARIEVTFSNADLSVEGVPSVGSPSAYARIEMFQYDDANKSQPYHLQASLCPNGQCARTTGKDGSGETGLSIPITTAVPKTGNARFDIQATRVTGGPAAVGQGTMTVIQRN